MNYLTNNNINRIPELSTPPGNVFYENHDIYSGLSSIDLRRENHLPHYLLVKDYEFQDGDDYTSSINKVPETNWFRAFISPARFMSDEFLAWDFKTALKAGFSGGAFFQDGVFTHGDVISEDDAHEHAELFVDMLMTGEGETWHDGGILSDGMRRTPEVQSFIRKAKKEFKSEMRMKFGNFWNIKLNRNNYPNISFKFSSSPTLKGLVGGTQRNSIYVKNIIFNHLYRTWSADLVLLIEDDFGVSESDVTNPRGASAKLAIPALADFWILQHQRGKKPFSTVFKIPFICSGTY